jgi:hypothetical protein
MSAFVIDDSVFPIPYAKKTELVSLVHDHAEKGKNKYKWGFRMLTLGWTDGASFVPLTFRHLASADKKNRRCEAKENLDKRSIAHRIRQEAVSKMTEVLLLHLQAAVKAGVKAKYVLFDSWYAYPATIQDVCAMGLQVVARVKDGNVKYLVGKTENGVEKKEKLTAKQIFTENRKRRGRSRYLLSVPIRLRCDKDGQETTMPAKLVYVRNRSKRNEWIALVSTDTTLSEDEIVALYGKRWDIEVFFKVCKSYLKLTGEFHQLSYDALTAHTTIVMIRYMILSAAKRTEQDPRSLGELFFTCYDEMADIKFEQSLILLISLLSEALTDSSLGLSEDQIMPIMDAFIGKLPANMRACLQPGFTKSK